MNNNGNDHFCVSPSSSAGRVEEPKPKGVCYRIAGRVGSHWAISRGRKPKQDIKSRNLRALSPLKSRDASTANTLRRCSDGARRPSSIIVGILLFGLGKPGNEGLSGLADLLGGCNVDILPAGLAAPLGNDLLGHEVVVVVLVENLDNFLIHVGILLTQLAKESLGAAEKGLLMALRGDHLGESSASHCRYSAGGDSWLTFLSI
jgi:hypothetical protein